MLTSQHLSLGVCAARRRAHFLPRQPETSRKTQNISEFYQNNSQIFTHNYSVTIEWISCSTHVDVQPQLVFITNISYMIQRVKCSPHCRACCAAHKTWHHTLIEANWKWVQFLSTWPLKHTYVSFCMLSLLNICKFTWDFKSSIFSSRSSGIIWPLYQIPIK